MEIENVTFGSTSKSEESYCLFSLEEASLGMADLRSRLAHLTKLLVGDTVMGPEQKQTARPHGVLNIAPHLAERIKQNIMECNALLDAIQAALP